VHYLDGYVGWLHNRRNGGAEFTVERDTVRTIVGTFASMARYVGGDWRTVAFDGDALTIEIPWSQGGGVNVQ
jgi:hypothetical protein